MAQIGVGKDITIVISADDQTKAAFQSAKQGMEGMGSTANKMAAQTERYERHWLKMSVGIITAVYAIRKAWNLMEDVAQFNKQYEEMQKLTDAINGFKTFIDKLILSVELAFINVFAGIGAAINYAIGLAAQGFAKFYDLLAKIPYIGKAYEDAAKSVRAFAQQSFEASKIGEDFAKSIHNAFLRAGEMIDKKNAATEEAAAHEEELLRIHDLFTKALADRNPMMEEAIRQTKNWAMAQKKVNDEIEMGNKFDEQKKAKRGATAPIAMDLTFAEIDNLKQKIELYDQYNAAIEKSNQSIERSIVTAAAKGVIDRQTMVTMLGKIQLMEIELAFQNALQSALVQYILGQQSLEQALKMALAQELAQIAAKSAINAIYETAMGIAAWASYGWAQAAAHFEAAAMFAGLAAGAGYAASSLAKSSGYGEGAQGSYSNPSYSSPSTGASAALSGGGNQQGNVTTVYYINAIDTQTFSEYVKKNSGAITGIVAQDIKTRGEINYAIQQNV